MNINKRISSFLLAACFMLCSSSVAQAAVLSEESDSNTESQYELGYYTLNGKEQECIVKVDTTTQSSTNTDTYSVIHRATYLIPTTTAENQFVEAFSTNLKSGINLCASDQDVDKWWQCQYSIEAKEVFETRYVQTSPGVWENYKFVGIEWVKYGFYKYKDGEGKASLKNAKVRAWLAGYTPNCFGPQVSQEQIIVPPNNSYYVANENSLLKWTPPSSWKMVATIPNAHAAGASFEATVLDSYGNTYELSIAAIIAALPSP